eukprot:5207924-Amphidinium_carterae.1
MTPRDWNARYHHDYVICSDSPTFLQLALVEVEWCTITILAIIWHLNNPERQTCTTQISVFLSEA